MAIKVGNNNIKDIIINENSAIKVYENEIVVWEKSTGRLPIEYQEVEYIESTGTQWINTGYFAQLNTKFTCRLRFTDLSISTRNGTYGNIVSGCRFYFGILNGLYIVGYGSSNSGYNHNVAIADTNIHEISIDNSHFLVDGISLLNYNRSWTSTKGNIILFAIITHDNNQILGKGNQILYYSNIYNNDILMKNFIPCYTRTSVIDVDGIERPKGTIGMYDTVERKFYTNQGTGTFIKGPDVN